MSNIVDYFDWYDLFINQVCGNEIVFIFLSFILISFACIRFKFQNIVTLTILGLWALIISAYFEAILPIVVFIIGSFFYWGISKMIKD